MASRRSSTDVGLDAQLSDPRLRRRSPRKVLVVGEIGIGLRDDLRARGATLVESLVLDGIFDLLAAEPFDVILVNSLVEGGGLDFVNALKEDDLEHERTKATLYGARGNSAFLRGVRPPSLEVLVHARSRHVLTPVIVLPLNDQPTYAVIVRPPRATALRSLNALPVATAVMTVNSADFFKDTGALA